MKHLSFALLVLGGIAGCGEVISMAAEGTLGGACRSGGTCDSGLVCENDVCVALTCSAAQMPCNGVCKDTGTDLMNCGACGKVCGGTNAVAACANGVCAPMCSTGFGACANADSGCTTNLLDDEANCGSCGNACNAGRTCEQGQCTQNLIVIADAGGSYVPCVVTGLMPYFVMVTPISGVPTATELANADAVLVFNNGALTDPTGLGNALADFSDAKGHVVEALYGTGNLGPLGGRWATDNYTLLTGSYSANAVTLGTIAEPMSPLMAGVATLGATRSVMGSATNGGIVVASFDNGMPVVVRGTKNGKNRVDLAIFPGGCSGAYWTGDGFRLMANALKF